MPVKSGSRDPSIAGVNVQGVIAHDAPDNELTNFPVKTGGHATAAQRPAVGEDDVADHSVDLGGRQRVRVASPNGDVQSDVAASITEAAQSLGVHDPSVGVTTNAAVVTDAAGTVLGFLRGLVSRASTAAQGLFAVGNVANGAVDSNNPVKVGGIAVADPTVGQAAPVAALQRVNAAHDLSGRQLVLVEGTQANDAAMAATNNPVNQGGLAQDQAPVLVSAVLDVVQAWLDRAGRQKVDQDLSIAGENLALNVLRVVRGKLAVEQESWDRYNFTTSAATLEPVAGRQIKASAGRVCEVHILNSDAVQYYVWVINATATGTTASVVDRFILPASGEVRVDYSSQDGLYCDTGIFIQLSTSLTALVNPGAISGIFHIAFI